MIIGDGIVLESGGGATASIFVTGVQQSDTVTCTKGGRSYNGRWVTKQNPLSHNLPSGYTELDYIECTGSQYLNTGIANNNSNTIEMTFIHTSSNSYDNLFGVMTSGHATNSALYDDSQTRFLKTDGMVTTTFSSGEHTVKVSSSNVEIDGAQRSWGSDSGNNATGNICLCAGYYSSNLRYGSFKLKSCKINSARNFIPCINPNNVVGMYDLINEQFYSSATSTAFIAGNVIPTYIYGYEFSSLNEYGTYTVSASGYISQQVNIDVATEFQITMQASVLYLIKNGIPQYNYLTATYYNNADSSQGNGYWNLHSYRASIAISDMIDLTSYSELHMECETRGRNSTIYNSQIITALSTTPTTLYGRFIGTEIFSSGYNVNKSSGASYEFVIDISSYDEEGYITVMSDDADSLGYIHITNLWLE